jgi:hypothetical protein
MLRYAVGVGAVVGALGCRETLPPVQKPVFKELTQEDVTATARKLVEMRGLALHEDPNVLLLSRAQYEAEIDRTHDTQAQDPDGALPALLGLLGPSAKRKPQPSEAEEVKKHVGAYYDPRDKTVRMPNTTPESRHEDVHQRAVLAHELHHAMQFQNFQRPTLDSPDAAMAFKALVEGDAEVAELLHAAQIQHLSASRMLRRARYAVAKPAAVGSLASPVGSTEWEALPLVSQALREFPYTDGLAFVVDLYRAGGFALVNKAYARPPANTEHVLHPDKYLVDERPREIADLDPPSPWTHAGRATLGELRIRVFLEPCLGKKVAATAAAGWHGDRAFVLEAEREWMLGWVSAWDTEADAIELEDALARMGPCLPASDAAGKAVAAPFSIRRKGAVVSFARGGEQADRSATLDRLLALPGDAKASSPVSLATVPPLREPPEPAGGGIEAEVYRSEFFGLTSDAGHFDAGTWSPAGSRLDLPKVSARKLRAGGTMGYSTQLATSERIPELFGEWEEHVIESFAKDGYETTRYQDLRQVSTGLGVGYERSWTQRRGVLVYRVTIIPICGGTGYIELSTVFSTNPGRDLMDYWIQSFAWTDPKKRPPVCEYLDPESIDHRSTVSHTK